MDKIKLEQLINENYTQRKIAEYFNVCQTTLRYWLRKFKLKTNFLKHNKKFTDYSCVVCNKKTNQSRKVCRGCNTKIRRYRAKVAATKLLGGRCKKCGWVGNIAGFEFHHIDTEKEKKIKSFGIGNCINKSWDIIKKELKKCELLCSCCHRIHHSNNRGENFLKAVSIYKGRLYD